MIFDAKVAYIKMRKVSAVRNNKVCFNKRDVRFCEAVIFDAVSFRF